MSAQLAVPGMAQGYLAVVFDLDGVVDTTPARVRAWPDAVALLHGLLVRNVATALVSPDPACGAVLATAAIDDLFMVRVEDADARSLALAGPPQPDMFLEAARRLEVDPGDVMVIAGRPASVRAGAAGGFRLVVGVGRDGTVEQLRAAGAHVVCQDLAVLGPGRGMAPTGTVPPSWFGGAAETASDRWHLVYNDFDPLQEGTREALCTLGNGYWATRGAAPGTTSDDTHYPGTYLAGVYNRVNTAAGGTRRQVEHLVNAPDWAWLGLQPAGGGPLLPGAPGMVEHHQVLDLHRGVLLRTVRYRDAAGRTTDVSSRQFQSMTEPYVAALEVTVTPEDWSGDLLVDSTVNGAVTNHNVAAERSAPSRHLRPVRAAEIDAHTLLLEAVTSQSQLRIAMAVRTRIDPGHQVAEHRARRSGLGLTHRSVVRVAAGVPLTVEKIAAVSTSRDHAISTAALEATQRILTADTFARLLQDHEQAWADLWDRFGIEIDAGAGHQLTLNLHQFHVLQAVAAISPDLDAGVPARGLHGEGYHGHIFWDELFVYPMLTLRRPELTRDFLLYRHRRLPAARRAARQLGAAGAMFPWQSGSDGREETPSLLFNVRNGQWMPDSSHLQRHVGLAVAYSVWRYYEATADVRFLLDHGAELIIEIARFFASLAAHDPVDDRFDLTGVMGPDEYHDGYPGRRGEGVRNNAYTNVLTAWVLDRAIATVDLLMDHDCDPLWHRLHLEREELGDWDRISRRLRVPFHADGIISQFEGYEDLEEFDWRGYRQRYGNIERLDLILQAEGDSPNRYKLSKQADVLMLFYLFSAEELRAVLARLDYDLPPEVIPRTVRYYLARTSHGSTLSRLVHGWVLARTNRFASWSLFEQALEADLADTQAGTTREGVHLGAMAGTADMVMRCYAGVETRRDVLWLHPVLPRELAAASFQLRYRDQPITVDLTHHALHFSLHASSAPPIRISAEGTTRTLGPGQAWDLPLTTDGNEPAGH
jgi:trehalose/maltose hydrolase-like predicted phosphorylase/beta-phosphoglucomutase-like phosphatase (HAD superfamily)